MDIFLDTCKGIPEDYAETTVEKFNSCFHARVYVHILLGTVLALK